MEEDNRDTDPDAPLETEGQNPAEETGLSPEILERMPPESRGRVVRSFSHITQFPGPVVNPVLQRITSEHLTQMLGNAEAQSSRDAEAEKSNRRYQFSYFIVTIVGLLSLLVFFTLREQFDLLTAIITGVAGLGAGFGLGRMTGRR